MMHCGIWKHDFARCILLTIQFVASSSKLPSYMDFDWIVLSSLMGLRIDRLICGWPSREMILHHTGDYAMLPNSKTPSQFKQMCEFNVFRHRLCCYVRCWYSQLTYRLSKSNNLSCWKLICVRRARMGKQGLMDTKKHQRFTTAPSPVVVGHAYRSCSHYSHLNRRSEARGRERTRIPLGNVQ